MQFENELSGLSVLTDLVTPQTRGREILARMVEDPDSREKLGARSVEILEEIRIMGSEEFNSLLEEGLKIDRDLMVHLFVADEFAISAAVQLRPGTMITLCPGNKVTLTSDLN